MDRQTQELLLQAVERAEGNLQTIKAILRAEGLTGPVTAGIKQTPPHASGIQNKRSKIHTSENLPADQLGPPPDYQDERWPEAVGAHLIVNNKGDTEKQFRALQVVGLMGVLMDGLNVLDCGCGEGHIAREAANQAKSVVGYDLRREPSWDRFHGGLLTLTTSKEEVESRKPYNFIILYDVLDHLEREEPALFMAWIASLLAPQGRVFVRTHPWTARHGGHLYEQGPNRAYLHLALTADEMAQAGFKLLPNLKLVRPMAAYEHFFKDAGLKILERNGHTGTVEPFFTGAVLDRIIKVTWRGGVDHAVALKIMANQFIDFHLTQT